MEFKREKVQRVDITLARAAVAARCVSLSRSVSPSGCETIGYRKRQPLSPPHNHTHSLSFSHPLSVQMHHHRL